MAKVESNGYKIIQTWQVILVIISMFIGIGISFGMAQMKLAQVEEKVIKLESWKEEHVKEAQKLQIEILEKLSLIREEIIKQNNKSKK